MSSPHFRSRALPRSTSLQGDVLRKGDSVWRVNNTVVTGCSFKDIINILSAVPRPFIIDFVRPQKTLNFGHTVVYNNIEFDMIRVDGGGESKMMPAAQLQHTSSVASLGSVRLKTKV